jgi:hypothetical protein
MSSPAVYLAHVTRQSCSGGWHASLPSNWGGNQLGLGNRKQFVVTPQNQLTGVDCTLAIQFEIFLVGTHNWMEGDMHLSAHIAQTTSKNTYLKASSIIAVVGGILLLGSTAGCTFFQALHQCGTSECPGDAKITAAVEARFQEHPSTQPPNTISVSTFKGVVYLDGAVDSARVKARRNWSRATLPG